MMGPAGSRRGRGLGLYPLVVTRTENVLPFFLMVSGWTLRRIEPSDLVPLARRPRPELQLKGGVDGQFHVIRVLICLPTCLIVTLPLQVTKVPVPEHDGRLALPTVLR